jgi:hypothetical protein
VTAAGSDAEARARPVPTSSRSRPVGIFANSGFLPNQLMKMSTSTTKATWGVANVWSMGFMASSNSPRPARQLSRTVRGTRRRSQSPTNDPTIRIVASTRHQTRAIERANSAFLVRV